MLVVDFEIRKTRFILMIHITINMSLVLPARFKRHLQTCCKSLKLLASSLWVKSLDDKLAISLFQLAADLSSYHEDGVNDANAP